MRNGSWIDYWVRTEIKDTDIVKVRVRKRESGEKL